MLYEAIRGHIVTLRGCKTGSKVIWLLYAFASHYAHPLINVFAAIACVPTTVIEQTLLSVHIICLGYLLLQSSTRSLVCNISNQLLRIYDLFAFLAVLCVALFHPNPRSAFIIFTLLFISLLLFDIRR